jgi:hypothetical protein
MRVPVPDACVRTANCLLRYEGEQYGAASAARTRTSVTGSHGRQTTAALGILD